ncbi:MAG: putative zinc metalloprotease [Syntrophomonadaceae bacterium]|nr:putative zinc metalloprotease [Bacillota bacterium]
MIEILVSYIIPIVFVLGILIFFHELGHLMMAKKLGVRVEKFSFGFGKKLFGFKIGDTEYLVSAFPLGGYVKMAGDDPEKLKGSPEEFFSRSVRGRIAIVAAGPVMNLLLVFFFMTLVGIVGFRLPVHENIVGMVEEGSPAENAEIRIGDRIISVGGQSITDWHALGIVREGILKAEEKILPPTVAVIIEREGETIVKELPLKESWGIEPYISAKIGRVLPGMPAHRQGLMDGDKIIAVNNQSIISWQGLSGRIHESPGEHLILTIEREGEIFNLDIIPFSHELPDRKIIGLIGIEPPMADYRVVRLGAFEAVSAGISTSISQLGMIYRGLWQLISQPAQMREAVGGPILIAQLAAEHAKAGVDQLILFIALLSNVLVVMNLLPIPVLDGGHILFFSIEGLRKRPLPLKVQNVLQQVGLSILVLLMLFTFVNDTLRQLERASAIRERQLEIEEKNGESS